MSTSKDRLKALALPLLKAEIRESEGLARKDPDGVHLRSYADPASPYGAEIQRRGKWNAYLRCEWEPPMSMDSLRATPWTIGNGLTGIDIGPNTKWTYAKAAQRLEERLAVELDGVLNALPADKMTPGELAAMASLRYNIGGAAFYSSTLAKMYRAGDKAGAAKQFSRWRMAGGKVNQGLINRREREKALFLGERA